MGMKTECAQLRRDLDEHTSKVSSQGSPTASVYQREAERRALREEVANLKTEARAMWESQDEVWRQHNASKERLAADVAELRRLLKHNDSHAQDATLQAHGN